MPLNPLRDPIGPSAPSEFGETGLHPQAELARSRFQQIRRDLTRQVRQGDITLKTAREKAAGAAREIRNDLLRVAGSPEGTARPFLDRLIAAADRRKRASEGASLESLQSETNRLLRLTLVEQQLRSREPEFEARTHVRPINGGQPAPTLETLLELHREAALTRDETAQEWARRRLETLRGQVFSDDDRRRIDIATDRPDVVNPRLLTAYVETMRGASAEELDTFVSEALESRDATACASAFVLARSNPDAAFSGWVGRLLDGIEAFPDAALSALTLIESETRDRELRAARAQAEEMARQIDADARLADLESPTDAELSRQSRHQALPLARWDEPIGLALSQRWPSDDSEGTEFDTAPEPA